MPEHKRSEDDLLTARQIAEEYGMPLGVAQDLVRNRDRNGLSVRFAGFRRVFVRRRDVEAQSGGITCE